MRTTLRWVGADLRAHRGEALFIVLATAGIIVSLLLAAALFGYAANPWQRVFTQSRGAHVWIHTRAGANAADAARQAGVEAVAGPFRTARTTAESSSGRAAVELRAAGTRRPEVARPLLTEGHWLQAGTADGIVLEAGLAGALWAKPGDPLTLPGADGRVRTLTVVGVAESSELSYSTGKRPGVAWVLPGALDAAGVPEGLRGQVVGLRLDRPSDTDFAVQRAVTVLGADEVTQVSDWRQARAEAQGDDRLLGLLIGLFGLGALLAAALAVVGAISTRIRGHLRDISVLKAIGFTPGQVVRVFLVQHLALALLGAVLGTVLMETLGASIPGRIGEAVGVWRDLPGQPWMLPAVPAAAVLFIATATGLAAWRAGRVPPVPVLQSALTDGGRMSALARGALGLRGVRVPAALVLGWRGAFPRRARTLATVLRLALPLLLITVAVATLTTLDRFRERPQDLGLAAALTARADGGLGDTELRRLLEDHPDVERAHPGAEVAALVPGQTGTIALRGLGTLDEPYPFALAEGRSARGPDEAVAGQGLLDLLDIEAGDWVRMTVEGRPQILHVVGRVIEPENGGRVLSTTVDSLRERDPALRAAFYQLELRPGTDAGKVRRELVAASDGRAEIREVTNPADRLSSVRGVVAGLIGVLALIGLTELLSMIGGNVRDRERDLFALKAIGLTPRQIMTVIMAAGGFTALAAAVLGTALGAPLARWLIDAQARSGGIGAGIAEPPPAWILLLITLAAVLGALLAAALPAARAVRHRLADTMSTVA
ncbi:FtsX-like permease family protein [Streptomyces sp. GC420]|uniref:ABC transporter permease n=1 Tax=Streptomyces sp. GC420 TaxID=2697568 RepID=UPI0014151FEB|nr:FtsX-like permease family protein [Streptomyces sp. GC420]NBM17000.1 FtsX-like permease family protein [Streptomyces sp. GC420]